MPPLRNPYLKTSYANDGGAASSDEAKEQSAKAFSLSPPEASEDNEDESKVASFYTQWSHYTDTNNYQASSVTFPSLPSGSYTINRENNRWVYIKKDIQIDDLIIFENSQMERILSKVDEFWDARDGFKKIGFKQRRGIMFLGPPGNGKTQIINQLTLNTIQKESGVAFYCSGSPNLLASGIAFFRQVERERPILCIFEDIDETVSSYGEAQLLSFFDGEEQVDKILIVATTNYPEKLDLERLARPRRFDDWEIIGLPDANMRRQYLEIKLKDNPGMDIERLVEESDGLSLAALASFIISTECLNVPIEEAIQKLHQRRTVLSSKDFKNGGKTGFPGKLNGKVK
jgi:SpoVK/Ycf46/Vps4 family AAA+-type ATPase